jgi:PAS domain S-box-containing protein
VTLRKILSVGLVASAAALGVFLLAVGLGLTQMSRAHDEVVDLLELKGEIDVFSTQADHLALQGATPGELARFRDRGDALRSGLETVTRAPRIVERVAEQMDRIEQMVAGMSGPGGAIRPAPGVAAPDRAVLGQIAEAGRALDADMLALLQAQRQTITQRVLANVAVPATLALIFLAGAVGLMTFVHRRVTRPMDRIRATVDRIGQGDLGARAPSGGHDEFGHLGQRINAMAQSLQRSEADLRETLAREGAMNAQLTRVKKIGRLGGWWADLVLGKLSWDAQTFEIFEAAPGSSAGTVEDFFARIHPDDRDDVIRYRQAQLARGEPIDVQHRIVTDTGRTLWVRERAEIITGETGEPIALDGTIQDITDLKATEAALEAARAQAEERAALLRLAGRTAHFGGWRVPAGADRVEWSPETALIHDEHPDRMPTIEEALDYYHPDDRPRIAQLFRACEQTCEEFDDVFRLTTASGRNIRARVTGEPVRDAAGRIVEVRGAFQDVTDLMALRDAAARRNADLVAVVDALGLGVVMLDETGATEFANAQARDWLGLTADDAPGAPLAPLLDAHPAETWPARLSAAVAGTGERRFTAADAGSGRDIEVTVETVATRQVVLMRDVTEDRATRRRLLLLEAAVNQTDDIVLITEGDRVAPPEHPVILYANAALERVTGYTRSEAVGRTPRLLQGPQTQRSELDRIARALKRWQRVRAELVNYTKAGTPFWLEIDIFPLVDPETDRRYFVAIERDITERKQREENEFQSAKLAAIGQLTGGVAHDFNNLLTIILGNADLLRAGAEAPDTRRWLDALIEAAERAAHLTDGLLAFSRRTPLEPEPTDVNALLRSSWPLLRQAVPESVCLSLDAQAEQPVAQIDPSRLQAAVINLVINGRDAIDGEGRVTLTTAEAHLDAQAATRLPGAEAGAYVRITVTDTGTGMDAQTRRRAFEPFFTTKGSGTGLGLSSVHGFLEQSGGHAELHSAPGEGTSVHLYLPRSDATPAHGAGPGSDQPDAAGGTHVLVVEDDPDLLTHAAGILRSQGCVVSTAETADIALARLRELGDRVDLLFTDVTLPGAMDGRALAAAARACHPGLRVLLTTGYSENAIGPEELTDGVTLLPKPYRRADLARKVADALADR